MLKHPQFPDELVRQAQLHAKSEYPNEACGLLLKDSYMPVKNWAEDPERNFQIKQQHFLNNYENILAVMHSHGDYPHISKADMEQQIETRVPWGVTLIDKGIISGTYFWGDSIKRYDLIGRPFVHGLFDCYSLVRDYWRTEGYDVMDFPRDNLWWEKDPSMLEDGVKEAGFDPIDASEIQKGDVIFMKVLASVVNHSGIYLGDGLLLHHLYNRFSRREPLNRWRKYICSYHRYTENKRLSC